MTAARLKGKLHAEVASAKQALTHIRNQDAHELRTGKEQATQVLDGEASKFDTKLGDMSATMADVERALQEHVAEASEMAANGTSSSANLDQLQKDLEAAEAKAAKQGA